MFARSLVCCAVPAQDLVEPFPTHCDEPLTLQGLYRTSIRRTIFGTLSRITQHIVEKFDFSSKALDKNACRQAIVALRQKMFH